MGMNASHPWNPMIQNGHGPILHQSVIIDRYESYYGYWYLFLYTLSRRIIHVHRFSFSSLLE